MRAPAEPLGWRPGEATTQAAALVTVAIWATSYPGIKVSLEAFAPAELAALRNLIAGACLAAVLAARRGRLPERKDVFRIVIAGALGVGVYQAFLNLGQTTVSAGSASLLMNTAPVFTCLLGAIFLRERLGGWGWAGVGVSFAGAGLIAISDGQAYAAMGPGALFIAAAALSLAVQMTLQRPLAGRYTALELTTYMILAGAAVLSPALGGAMIAARAAWDTGQTAPLVSLLFLALAPGALAYTLWTFAASRMQASRLSTYLYLVAPLSLLLSAAWLGEPILPISVAGGALAIGGVVLIHRMRPNPAANPIQIAATRSQR